MMAFLLHEPEECQQAYHKYLNFYNLFYELQHGLFTKKYTALRYFLWLTRGFYDFPVLG